MAAQGTENILVVNDERQWAIRYALTVGRRLQDDYGLCAGNMTATQVQWMCSLIWDASIDWPNSGMGTSETAFRIANEYNNH